MQTASNRTRIRIVQSRANARLKQLRAGLARGGRTAEGQVAVEGLHLVEEALRSGLRVTEVFLCEGREALLDPLPPLDAEILVAPAGVFASAVATESPQGIAALVEAPAFTADDLFAGTPLLLVADGLQDPGNLGTLVRSAEAFGATGMIALPGTVSLWNPKALRASSGSAFRLPVVTLAAEEALSLLRSRGVQTLAAVAAGGVAASRVDLRQPCALLIGNEGSGLSQNLIDRAGQRITIPCPGPVESLNAAVAASVLLYEAARQRGSGSAGGRR